MNDNLESIPNMAIWLYKVSIEQYQGYFHTSTQRFYARAILVFNAATNFESQMTNKSNDQ